MRKGEGVSGRENLFLKVVEFISRDLPNLPNPTEDDFSDPAFEAIWIAIKDWDINTPHYEGYCGGNGSHVKLILEALREANVLPSRDLRQIARAAHSAQIREAKAAENSGATEGQTHDVRLDIAPEYRHRSR